ncbi:GSCFA domain-containing protein [Sphingomonas profundi]|uniref:GSCFA domain-containing protein n=1 Tax=Alterirhizorhabdus profundi TaxID=2681549 RepID=UPI0012E939E3|nr:GSCFA domain-containing protein [Sphingomonas profundi]
MSSPYSTLKDYQFWRRAVSRTETHLFDPVVAPRFRIAADARVATAGSCFAQHISRRLREIDFNYYIPEAGEHLPAEERGPRNYGVFSARFGNLYTTAQLHQLFLEAFGERIPHEMAWRRPDGRYVDAYRQQVEPAGFASANEVAADRARHLAAVRAMFLNADVFVFTMGLTEAWRSRVDGSVFPLAPGVVAGSFDPERYEAVNFGVEEVRGDLVRFLDRLKAVNPGVRVLLTVSPVPLIATFEDRNVLCSTTYSKSVLRVVADMVTREHDWTDYFPSFEIITGSYAGGLYYEDDYRDVNRIGVAHAMRCFLKNYVERDAPPQPDAAAAQLVAARAASSGVICDEEAIDAIRA